VGGPAVCRTHHVVVLQLDGGAEGGRVPVQGVDAGAGGAGGQLAGRRVGVLVTVTDPSVPDIEVVKAQSVIISIVLVRWLGLDDEFVFDGTEILLELSFDPAAVKV